MSTVYDTRLDDGYQAMMAAQDAYDAECAAVPDYRRDADSLDASCPIEADEPTEADWLDFAAWWQAIGVCPCGNRYTPQSGITMCAECGADVAAYVAGMEAGNE